MDKKRATIRYMKISFMLAIFLALSCCLRAEAKKCNKAPIRIAVIDTGFGLNDLGHEAHLCQFGHKDFSGDKKFTKNYGTHDPVPVDSHGHGTNIVGIIDGYASKAHINYCFVIVKFYNPNHTGLQNVTSTIRAINYAANIHADYINYSGGGPELNRFEKAAVKRYLNHGGHLIAAAGNEGANLDNPENAYYPALYDNRIIVVGNTCKSGVRCKSSNYGKAVARWEVGEEVTAFGVTMTGTSQATAVATGKIVAGSDNKCDIGF